VTGRPDLQTRFREIILTAPDIDVETFQKKIVPHLVHKGPAVTLYASSEDLALQAAKMFDGASRVGDTIDGLVVVPGIDTIDATGMDTSFLKHSYFAEARSVLGDIFHLFHDGHRPDDRFGLETVVSPAGRHWRFLK
jgi:esterase/lipase superfamily enzyme